MYKNCLFATDLAVENHDLAHRAVQFAQSIDATLHLLHVIEPPASVVYASALGFSTFPAPVTEDAEIVLETLANELGVPKQCLHVKIGTIKHHVIETADNLRCDLIIVGSHGHHGTSHILGGSANAVLADAHCDVLTLRMPAN